MFNIPIAKTNLNDEEINSVLEPLKSGWLVQGSKVNNFEKVWSEFVGCKQSIAVTSCTSALYLSLAALGFSKDDEAIVPAFTWISTANVIEHLGGKVVFVDIDLNTFNIDFTKIEERITDRTKAILPVHLFGLPAAMNEILKIARKYNLVVVEDAACGFGSKLNQTHVGTFGNTGCFSFHPRKAITTGEGGMITTNDEELAIKMRRLRDHGASLSDHQRHLGPKPYLLSDHKDAGFNLRMTDIQAALGLAQMKRAKKIVNERKKIADKYNSEFKDLTWLKTPLNKEFFTHGYQSYPCLFETEEINWAIENKKYDLISNINNKRNRWMDNLQKRGISTRPSTHAVHMLEFYKKKYNIKREDFPNSWIANDCSISLPLFHGLSKEEQDYLISVVLERNY
tara:strand:+ start:122 stop:1312 length:1191 start_codon:yes stop_codon:yes gene_type:complete